MLDIRFHLLQFESILNFTNATRYEYEVSLFCYFMNRISVYIRKILYQSGIFNKNMYLNIIYIYKRKIEFDRCSFYKRCSSNL